MRIENDGLLARLERYELDKDGAFSARLARENGWSRRHTARVVAEYRRFLWLARVAEHSVTPSELSLDSCDSMSFRSAEMRSRRIAGSPAMKTAVAVS